MVPSLSNCKSNWNQLISESKHHWLSKWSKQFQHFFTKFTNVWLFATQLRHSNGSFVFWNHILLCSFQCTVIFNHIGILFLLLHESSRILCLEFCKWTYKWKITELTSRSTGLLYFINQLCAMKRIKLRTPSFDENRHYEWKCLCSKSFVFVAWISQDNMSFSM